MYSLTTYRPTWQNGCRQGSILLVGLLLILSLARLFFIAWFGHLADYALSDLAATLWMGFRVDLKWSLIALLPAWILWVVGYGVRFVRDFARVMCVLGVAVMCVLAVVNIGFFAFYRTPISSIIFGLWQDDTRAILVTVWSDWPVLRLVALTLLLTALPFVAAWAGGSRRIAEELRLLPALITIVLLSALIGVGVRGGLSKFPLRLQDWAVTTDAFLNAAVPNGAASLYEAWKSQQMLVLKGSPEEGLKKLGFENVREAEQLLKQEIGALPNTVTPLRSRPDFVIFALMESMGRDEFDSDRSGNDTLGALRDVLNDAQLFRQGIAVEGGTFPSLEGILFDSPISPITQSRYGDRRFPFSRLWAYHNAGYECVFLTSGSVSWRQMDRNFPKQGFDVILGDRDIQARFPEAQVGTWGVGDEWMFRYATELLEAKARAGKKVFLFMLSTTNHPPHVLPQGAHVNAVNPMALPPYVVDDRADALVKNRLQTYQYSANALGNFVKSLKAAGLSSRSVIVATGDHNSRMHYEASGYWHHANGVPILFWVPMENFKGAKPDLKRWVSHRDIFPTLNALVLGMTPSPTDGRNLFAPEDSRGAQSFATMGNYGVVFGSSGAAAIGVGGVLSCYRWEADRMVPETPCSAANLKLGQIARAQRALRDADVRATLLAPESKADRSEQGAQKR